MSRIFISYKRVDKDKVFKIKDQIESALGEKCWIDLDGIESDAQFVKVIINAIDEAEVFLFMHSAAHSQIVDFENDWTIRELNYAKEEKKSIVFINIDEAPLTKWFKFMFPQKQQVDATSEDAVNKLCEDMERRLFPERVAERERKREEAEKEAQRKLKEEEDERIRKEAEEKARKVAEQRAREEEFARLRRLEEERVRKETEEKARREAAEMARKVKEAEARARAETEQMSREEEDMNRWEEEEEVSEPVWNVKLWGGLGAVAVAGIIIGINAFGDSSSIEDSVQNHVSSIEDSIRNYTVKGVSFGMIKVEAGSFKMGDYQNDEHAVALDCYCIGETEVTQALWKAVMGNNPSFFPGDNHPVEKVSWDDCQEFIKKLNKETGREFRLPTEAEWEFAARGGNKSLHTIYSGSNELDEVAWHKSNSRGMTHPVKAKKPNELGIYDMTGNVWEWCQDCYGSYKKSPQTNPRGPLSGSDRVGRGGSWFNDAGVCRLSYRYNSTPDYKYSGLGFRLALSE